ncbi:hypothetical protein Purlil1_14270 [Purpureocillium lilacinum]|uniref:Uncharacterized protein n=1 Tax=Purpureocillium lilacinum TaxID=33203 RepID=A0ABR0BBR1_PURLI|nr:hypothetical protein Purlil1_14270 [Purpureocillium lilacinum]
MSRPPPARRQHLQPLQAHGDGNPFAAVMAMYPRYHKPASMITPEIFTLSLSLASRYSTQNDVSLPRPCSGEENERRLNRLELRDAASHPVERFIMMNWKPRGRSGHPNRVVENKRDGSACRLGPSSD